MDESAHHAYNRYRANSSRLDGTWQLPVAITDPKIIMDVGSMRLQAVVFCVVDGFLKQFVFSGRNHQPTVEHE